MCLEPVLGSKDYLVELFCLWGSLQFGLTLALLNPEDSVVRIRIDDLVVQPLLPTEGEGMDDS